MADDKERLVLLLEAQTKAFENALKGARTTADIEADKIERRTKKMAAESAKAMNDFQNKVKVGALALSAALTAGFAVLQNQVLAAVRSVAVIDGIAQQLGTSTRFVQEFRFAVFGISGTAEQADAALTSLSRALGQLNTETGRRAREALMGEGGLGFTEEEVARMTDVEQALPLIAERIHQLGNASEQAAIAQKLGLEPVLELLQQGSEKLRQAAIDAHHFGYVLDDSLIKRAGVFEDEWTRATNVIDINFKAALVDLAPLFVDLAIEIARATRGLVEFLDQFKEIERRSRTGLFRSLRDVNQEQSQLLLRFGQGIREGGVANPDIHGARTLALQPFASQQTAANLFATLDVQRAQIEARLRDLEASAAARRPPPAPPGATDPDAAEPAESAAEQQRAYQLTVAEGRIERAIMADERAHVLAMRGIENALDEAHAAGDERIIRALERRLELTQRISELESLGVSAAAADAQARAEIAALDRADMRGQFRTWFSDGVMASLDGDLRDYFASWLQGRFEEGLRSALDSLADAAFDTFGESVADLLNSDDGLGALRTAADETAAILTSKLAASATTAAVEEGIKSAAVATAATTEAAAALKTAAAAGVLTNALLAAAAAASASATSDSGSFIASFVKGFSFGGSKQSGGPIQPGFAYRVHKDEMIVPTVPSYVIPKGMMGGGTTIQQIDQRTINFTGTSEELQQLRRVMAEDRAARRSETVSIVRDAQSRRHLR